MDNPKAQLAARIQESNNVLITVSNNPSVDQLAAALGLTLLLNKLGKHATAVYSGSTPSTIEFLQPDKTLEKNTNSLRDFIIALDKSKADKLRYKIEDQHVKIFITPYRTSLSEKDLEFSQGDFNVDVVIALGVHEQKELDQAIMAHGRILHDATVSTVNNKSAGNLGSINWIDSAASSLCEMVTGLCNELKTDALDGQMATALLTGIVAETKRFSNEKTTSTTMSISAQLMSAGANQQLVAAKLQEKTEPTPPFQTNDKNSKKDSSKSDKKPSDEPKPLDGALEIQHTPEDTTPQPNEAESEETDDQKHLDQIRIDDQGTLSKANQPPKSEAKTAEDKAFGDAPKPTSRLVLEPPTLGSKLSANIEPEHLDPATDPIGAGADDRQPLLSHEAAPPATELPEPVKNIPPADDETLTKIEESVDSPHLEEKPAELPVDITSSGSTPALNSARDAVQEAVNSIPDTGPLKPRFDLNAQPVDLSLNQPKLAPTMPAPATPPNQPGAFQPPAPATAFPPLNNGLPATTPAPIWSPGPPAPDKSGPTHNLLPSAPPQDMTSGSTGNPTPPPPVPPPMMPPNPFSDPNGTGDNNTNLQAPL